MTTKYHWLALLVLCLQLTSTTSQFFYKTTKYYYFFWAENIMFCRAVNGAYYNDWTVPSMTFFAQMSVVGWTYYYTTSINTITSGPQTNGYALNINLINFNLIGFQMSIADSNINSYNSNYVWYNLRFLIFALPPNAAIAKQDITTMIYSTIGNNLFTLTNKTYTQTVTLPNSLKQLCYRDKANGSIKDKVHLIPSITQISINNPSYVNLTSPSNWAYDWNNSTASLNYYLTISAYVSQAQYVTTTVLAACPNSYTFTTNNVSFAYSPNNWIAIEPNTQGNIKYRTVQMDYPIDVNTFGKPMFGLFLTGFSLYYKNLSSLVPSNVTNPLLSASFNITLGYNASGAPTGYLGNLSYSSVMPQTSYGFYWNLGYIYNCPNNFSPYNRTHCFCNPSLQLTYDPLYSVTNCRQYCFYGYYFSYTISQCVSCQLTYSFLCSDCNSTTCFNCTNGLSYYLKGTIVLCLNCSSLFGSNCQSCSDTACTQCANNFVFASTSNCTCNAPDRFLTNTTTNVTNSTNITQCVLCITQFPNCLNCTASTCLACTNNYNLINGTCTCLSPSVLVGDQCQGCSDLFGTGCQACNTTCLSCLPGYYLDPNTFSCVLCSSSFGPYCLNCTSAQCLACQPNFQPTLTACICPSPSFLLINSTCSSCSIFSNCLQCNSSGCLVCSASYLLSNSTCICPIGTFNNGSACLPCTTPYPHCITCTALTCLTCSGQFQLALNGSCSCIVDRYIQNGSCLLCSTQVGCLTCLNSTSCQQCQTSYNLVNGTCTCATFVSNAVCVVCSSYYGVGCTTCNASMCLSCGYNYILIGTNCACPNNTFVLYQQNCMACSEIFPYCNTCTNSSCLTCVSNYIYQNNTCTCTGNWYQTINESCQMCNSSFPNCQSCLWSGCSQCYQNYTISNNNCQCVSPMILIHQSNVIRCQLCTDYSSPDECALTVQAQYYQSAQKLYFWLKFNQNVNFTIGIQYNIAVFIGTQQYTFQYSQSTQIFEVDLTNLKGQAKVFITIPKKTYVTSRNLILSNDPSAFPVSGVNTTFINENFTISIIDIRNYYLVLTLILLMGVLNRLFSHSILVLIMAFSQDNLPSPLGFILNLLNWSGIYNPFSIQNTAFGSLYPSNDIKVVLFGLNRSIIDISLQLYAMGIASLCLFGYIRGYLKAKRNSNKHRAFRNILNFGPEYCLQNIICLHQLLCFPALLQLKLIFQNGVQSLDGIGYCNLIFSAFLLILPIVSYFYYFSKFSPSNRRYAVLYFQMQSQKFLVCIFTVVSALRPYIISILAIYLPFSANLWLILIYNCFYLILLTICGCFTLNRWAFALILVKSTLSVFINAALFITDNNSLFLSIGSYLVIAIMLIQFAECSVKFILLLLRNKGIINDDYEEVKHSPEQESVLKNSNQKKINSNMLTLIDKARNQLSQILAKRKKRND